MIASVATILLALAQDDAQVRAAVERSLPTLEKEGVAWIQKRDCLSCHHVPFLLWSHREAQAKGIATDSGKLAGWADWSRKESIKRREKVKLTEASLEALRTDGLPTDVLGKLTPADQKHPGSKEEDFLKELGKKLSPEELEKHRAAILKHLTREKGDGGGLDSMVQLLLGGSYDPADAEFAASTRARILELQQADGSWKPGGQLFSMNRSAAEATQITTMWALLALLESSDPASKESLARGRATLNDARAGKVLEWLVARLLLAKKLGETDVAEALLKELPARQNSDGGWASLQGAASDPFATGLALYALSGSGSGDAAGRGRKYLLESQLDDGSWTVPPGLLSKRKATPILETIYKYWGSAWATIGLASTLPAKP